MKVRDAARWVVWGTRVVVRGLIDLIGNAGKGSLRDLIRPAHRYPTAEDVPYTDLAAQGFEAVLFDLENTLIPPGGPWSTEGDRIVGKVRDAGLRMAVVSNCSSSWVAGALDEQGIAFVAPAGKPSRKGFERGCELTGSDPAKTIYVGDQVLTDVLGSQMAGLTAVLVEPRWVKEQRSAKAQRLVVKAIHRIYGEGK